MTDRPASGAPAFEEPKFAAAEDLLDEELLDDEEEELEEDEDDELDSEDEPLEGEEDDLDAADRLEDELDEDEDEQGAAAAPSGNRLAGGTARAVLEHVARFIVDDPQSVLVDVSPARSGVKLSLHVAPSDMGRIIGRRGRVAQALRTVVRAAAAKDGSDAVVDIVD